MVETHRRWGLFQLPSQIKIIPQQERHKFSPAITPVFCFKHIFCLFSIVASAVHCYLWSGGQGQRWGQSRIWINATSSKLKMPLGRLKLHRGLVCQFLNGILGWKVVQMVSSNAKHSYQKVCESSENIALFFRHLSRRMLAEWLWVREGFK